MDGEAQPPASLSMAKVVQGFTLLTGAIEAFVSWKGGLHVLQVLPKPLELSLNKS